MSQELEKRADGPGAAVVKAVPIPRELQEVGVRLGRDESSGMAVVYLPDALRDVVNVVNPVSSYVQADPNWSPGISLVTITEDQTYPLPGGKKGLSKQALEALSKAAGVLYTRTARVPRDELQEGELWAYRATVGFRRSDGTIDEVTRERGFNSEAERAEIEDAVARSDKFDGEQAVSAEIRKRWLNELRFGPAKTESKAINRALRAGLGIPSSVDRKELAKPWLVIGFNFTPNYDDPEVKRALVAVAMNAQQAIYGGRDVSDEMPEITAGDIPAEAVTPAQTEPADGDVAPEPGGVAGEQAEASREGEASAPRSDEPDLDGESSGVVKIPKKVIDDAGAVVAREAKGDTPTRTVAEVVTQATSDDDLEAKRAREWIIWALRSLETDDERVPSLRLYLEQREPALWEEIVSKAVES